MPMLFGIFVTVVGVALIAWGIRGRRFADDARRCRRCGYDLRATTSERCPECGASLAGRRATRAGRVWRRPRWIVVGVAVALVGGATIGLDRGGLLTERTVDRLTPTAWLLWRMRSGSPAARIASVDTLTFRWNRERERFGAGQQRRFLSRLLDRFRVATYSNWPSEWRVVLDRAYSDGSMPSDLRARYVREMLVQSFSFCVTRATQSSTGQSAVWPEVWFRQAAVDGYRGWEFVWKAHWMVDRLHAQIFLDGVPIEAPAIALPLDGVWFDLSQDAEPHAIAVLPLQVLNRSSRLTAKIQFDVMIYFPGPDRTHRLRRHIDRTFDLIVGPDGPQATTLPFDAAVR